MLTQVLGIRLDRSLPLALAVLLLSACVGVTPIRELLDDPSRYDGKTVRVRGEVQGSIGGLGVGAYEIKDETGTLAVVSEEREPPRSGANIGVKGKFQALLNLGFRSLSVLREEDRDY
jgi:hypothetical protein